MSNAAALAFKRAVESVGGPAAAGSLVGCSRQNIHQLLERKSSCPAGYVRLLSDASGVRRCQLRPDLYPEDDEPTAPPPGWGKVADPGVSPAELEAAGQLSLLPEGKDANV
jgi:DNA-binding transcriptional regulator YdaS (Cro superfamily)